MATVECGANSVEVQWMNGMTVAAMRSATRFSGLVNHLDIQTDAVLEMYDDLNDSWVPAADNDVIGADDQLRFTVTGGEKGLV